MSSLNILLNDILLANKLQIMWLYFKIEVFVVFQTKMETGHMSTYIFNCVTRSFYIEFTLSIYYRVYCTHVSKLTAMVVV